MAGEMTDGDDAQRDDASDDAAQDAPLDGASSDAFHAPAQGAPLEVPSFDAPVSSGQTADAEPGDDLDALPFVEPSPRRSDEEGDAAALPLLSDALDDRDEANAPIESVLTLIDPAAETAYSAVDDALTCHVVHQHLAPPMPSLAPAAPVAEAAECLAAVSVETPAMEGAPEGTVGVGAVAGAERPTPESVAEQTRAEETAAYEALADETSEIEPPVTDAGPADAAEADLAAAVMSVEGLIFEPDAGEPPAIPAAMEVAGLLIESPFESTSTGAEPSDAVPAPHPEEAERAVVGRVAPTDDYDLDVDVVAETAVDAAAAASVAGFVAESDKESPAKVVAAAAIRFATDDAAAPAAADHEVLAAASAPVMAYADDSTPDAQDLLDAEADELDPEPEAADATPVTGGMWTIPMLCLGIAIIACCVIIPQTDSNRRLVHERERLRRDAGAIVEQVKVNDEFLRKVADDPSLAERLAQRQMKIIRRGTRVLDLKMRGYDDETEMSPYHLVSVPAPDPPPPFHTKGGLLTQLCLNPHTRLYLMGGALVLMAGGLVLGYVAKRS
jgi:hypothetical protein